MMQLNSVEDEIIKLAKEDNEIAINNLFTKYKWLIHHISKDIFIPGGEKQDVIQESMIGFHKAIQGYKFDLNTSFRTFSTICIKRHLYGKVKEATRKKRISDQNIVYIDSEEVTKDFISSIMGIGTENSPEVKIIEKEELNNLSKVIEKELSKFEKKILMYRVSGYSYNQIIETMNCTHKTVDNALYRVRKKIKDKYK